MRDLLNTRYLLPAAVFGSATLGISLAIAMPYLLGRTEYARFSLILSVVQLISSLCFEWIRVSAMRHVADPGEVGDKRRVAILSFYVVATMAVLAVAALFAIFAPWSGTAAAVAAVCATAALQGAFDGRSVVARAQFQNVTLAIAMVARPLLTIALAASLALFTRSALGAISGLALSYLVTFLVFRDRPRLAWRRPDRQEAAVLVRFGTAAALGTNIAIAVPAALRSMVVLSFGVEDAGGTLLAIDISQRVFSTVGMAFNLLHLQTLIRTIDTAPLANAVRRARYSIAVEFALYALLVATLTAAAGPIGAVLAPQRFEADFILNLPIMALLMAGLSFRQYAIEPLFIAWKRAALLPLGPSTTLLLIGVSFAAMRTGLLGPEHLLLATIGASAAGLAIPLLFLCRLYPGCVPFAAMAGFFSAGILASTLTPSFATLRPVAALISSGLTCSAIFVIIAGPVLWTAQRIAPE